MKKKQRMLILTITSLLVLILGIFLVTINQNEEQIPPTQDDTTETTEEEEIEQATEEQESTTTGDIEETEETNAFKDTVKEVVIDALNFFKKDTHITAIGDSLTQGVGDETENGGYVGILEEQFREADVQVTIDNFGKRGNRTDQLLKRLEKEEIVESIEESQIVLITIGANDIMKIVKDNFMDLTEEPFIQEQEPYNDRLTQIIERIQSINNEADIYLLGFYNPFEKYFSDIEALNSILTRWNNESRVVANEFDNVTYIPMEDIYQNRSGNFFAEDNFHPNYNGYELMANRVWSYLQSSMNIDNSQ
ncbi:GDSL-type esterase/lipase family protein [Gracilibacillus marinus]|jgi:lysophospholipase L1-like esterase|uniref:GDSL-type esterase/lipase family protein n=1 Tax=Gracilibacillus marinus TaxID=630535 RepID=A0ABV8VR20_9BACI